MNGKDAGGYAPTAPVAPVTKPKGKSHKMIFIVAAIIVIIIIGATLYYVFFVLEAATPGGGTGTGASCGDGICDAGEDYMNCASDCPAPPPPPGPQSISVSPAAQTVNVGDTFTIDVNIVNGNDLYGFQFNVEYDSSVLEYDKTEEGTFLNGGNPSGSYPIDPTVSSGLLKNIASTKLGPVSGRTGDGVLKTITFKALSSGTSDIKISNIKFVSSKAERIDTTGVNGQVTVS